MGIKGENMFGNDRKSIRAVYFTTWKKHKDGAQLEPYEQQVLAVMFDHPEYHAMLEQPERYLDKDYLPEFGDTNPFFHMGLHLAVRDQVALNRPEGIAPLFEQLVKKLDNAVDAEHAFIEQLGEGMWVSMKENTPFDEAAYIRRIHSLLIT